MTVSVCEQTYMHEYPSLWFGYWTACGEGFLRCAYATSFDDIKEAMARLKRFTGKL